MSPAEPGADAVGLGRRLAAIFYDTLLLLSVLFFATAAVLPFNHWRAIEPGNGLYDAYLLALGFAYFGWFWTHGGQTLGMKAWRIRLRPETGGSITWRQALTRFCAAAVSWLALGLGFWWSLADPGRRAWHDRLSHSRLRLEPRRAA